MSSAVERQEVNFHLMFESPQYKNVERFSKMERGDSIMGHLESSHNLPVVCFKMRVQSINRRPLETPIPYLFYVCFL